MASTPACAGLTFSALLVLTLLSLYPRVRGADTCPSPVVMRTAPLPPRARG